MNEKDERTWASLMHVAGPVGYLFGGWATNLVLVLVLWLVKRNDSKFVDEQGKEALNFQLTLSILSFCLMIILGIITGIWAFGNAIIFGDGFHIFTFGLGMGGVYSLLKLINIIFSVLAAVEANKGVHYRYPISMRFVK
ncbi:DUF4870 domain-containing protein [Chitinophaga sp. Cy-1792]|uniref:DUF4870 domain-containing protein n=1 Tax=Chitinophaga sp. Cy-1792 TaxID=2608339 RepID=UPI0014234F16|nr:DUF4870 domain-containing protein [Chitinophaga sp. Cy-1792]NIG56337.1 DUF4870 domain-containing protein [Chitinophaga sp. Cy-1792]